MLATVVSGALTGFDSQPVEIECDITNGLPALIIVGLPNKAVDEAKERVKGAIKNSGLKMPQKRITLNLAPADLPKDGTAYDLPMAIAILAATGQVEPAKLRSKLFVGELSLEGSLRPVRGALSYAQMAKDLGAEELYVPIDNALEAALIPDIKVFGIKNLEQIYRYLIGEEMVPAQPLTKLPDTAQIFEHDMSMIYGQEQAKRALEIAAAGNHNILFTGPPGAGKTLLARALLSILPPPSLDEVVEITKIHSLAGNNLDGIVAKRPLRTPHHTASDISLIGGGQKPRPGEISLSHHGILFLDELPEFKRSVLEVLRQPLEDKIVTVSRAAQSVTYPARFMLVATQNPCPCGYADDPLRDCSCSPHQITSYRKRISGPLLDRLDLVVHVNRVDRDKLLKASPGESSQDIAHRVKVARERQKQRYKTSLMTNADMSNSYVKEFCKLEPEATSLLEQALFSLDLSARAYMRVLKVARTIADLEQSELISSQHLSEALQYRSQR